MTAIFISPHIGQYGAERSMIAIMKSLKQSGIIPVVIIPKEGLGNCRRSSCSCSRYRSPSRSEDPRSAS